MPRSLKWSYFRLSNKTYVFTYFPMCVTCPVHIILLDLINQKIILCEKYYLILPPITISLLATYKY
jgi:hypothetical protein